MAGSAYRVKVKPTFKDLQGLFARANKELLRVRRDELRSEGRFLTSAIKARLRAKIGRSKIEGGIRFNTRQAGDSVSLNVTTPGRARPHRIEARNAAALSFFWPKVGMRVVVPRQGGFRTHVRNNVLWIGKGGVDHPGGSLVPLMKPIVEDVSSEWQRARGRVVLGRIATRYKAAVTI